MMTLDARTQNNPAFGTCPIHCVPKDLTNTTAIPVAPDDRNWVYTPLSVRCNLVHSGANLSPGLRFTGNRGYF